jgi:hypothetical protein
MPIIETPPRPKSNKRGSPEGKIQSQCVAWFWNEYPEYRSLLFHIPNEGNRDSKTDGAYRKALGLVAGVSDLMLLVARGPYHGLCIEMKTETGRQSDVQKEWQLKVEKQGYKYIVVRSLEQFKEEISKYLSKNFGMSKK